MLNWAELSKSCAKTLLLVLNGCCILLALCTFVFAVVDTRILKQYGEESATGSYMSDVIIILASLLLVAVTVFGSVGTIRENVKILYLFTGFLMVMVVLEVFIAIYVSIQRYGLEFRILEWLREDFFHNVTGDTQLHEKLWNDLQTTYECCGLNGPDDYQAIEKEISLSCCPRAFRARTALAQQHLYQTCISNSTADNRFHNGVVRAKKPPKLNAPEAKVMMAKFDAMSNGEISQQELNRTLPNLDAYSTYSDAMSLRKAKGSCPSENLSFKSASYYAEGCEDEILFVLRSDADWLIGVAVTSFWFETFGILLAMWVANNAKNNVQVYKQTVRY